MKHTFKKLTLDMVPVFLAVFLAYQVNEYRSYREEQRNIQEAIKNIRLELVANRQEAELAASRHATMLENLDQVMSTLKQPSYAKFKSFNQLLRQIAPETRNLAIPRLTSISFETARTKNALSLMDYESINVISRVYETIEAGLKRTQDVLVLSISKPEVMRLDNIQEVVIILYNAIGEMQSQEEYLVKVIDAALEHLETHYPDQTNLQE